MMSGLVRDWEAQDRMTRIRLIETQDVPLPVFPVSLEEEPTVLDRLLSVTCADLVVCSHPPRSGESGTKRSTSDKSERYNPSNSQSTEC